MHNFLFEDILNLQISKTQRLHSCFLPQKTKKRKKQLETQSFIDILKQKLKEKNRTTECLFVYDIVSKNTFYKYKHRYPSLGTLMNIANYLRMSIDYIFNLTDTNTFLNKYVYKPAIFYNNLINLLNNKNISGRQFCKDLNFSSYNITRWKNGNTPKVENLLDISKYLNCLIDDLLF